jgi:hypothetical protein
MLSCTTLRHRARLRNLGSCATFAAMRTKGGGLRVVMCRFKSKPVLKADLALVGVDTYAEMARQLANIMGDGNAPSRQYLSRIFQPGGDATTSPATAQAICDIMGAPVAEYFDTVEGAAQWATESGSPPT